MKNDVRAMRLPGLGVLFTRTFCDFEFDQLVFHTHPRVSGAAAHAAAD